MEDRWAGLAEFAAVARAGGFTAAASRFGASVTHMSRAVARLEGRLGVQLLLRNTRSMRLTETGRAFVERCQRLVDDRDEALASVSPQAAPTGTLRLTCSHALGERFVAPLVRAFAQEHERLTVDINFDNQVVDLLAGEYDLAIRTGHLEDSRLIATRVADRELVTVGSRAYLDRRGEPTTVAELARHDCLAGSAPWWRFRDGQTHAPAARWRCNSGAALQDACLAGLGLAQLPAFYLGDHRTSGRLREVLMAQKAPDEPIWAVYPTRRHLSPKVSLLVAKLRAELPDRLRTATPAP